VTAPGDERRVHPRFPKSFELTGSPAAGGTTARLIASNLSLGGVYCTSDRDFAEMTRLAVRLMLPSRNGRAGELEPLDISAVVVRRKKLPSVTSRDRFELALLFVSLNAFQRGRIAHFLHPSPPDASV
jgi:hypothetical protein